MNDSFAPLPAKAAPFQRRLLLIDFILAIVLLLFFGVCGGFFLLVTLNGFSESEAAPILITYAVIAIGGNFLFTFFINSFFLKRWENPAATGRRAALWPAVISTIVVFVGGPTLWLLYLYLR